MALTDRGRRYYEAVARELPDSTITALAEFKHMALVVQGVVGGSGGRTAVIVDGEVFEEGEYMNEHLFVRTVRPEETEFIYKGISLLMRH